jgi:hypothetical protein
LPRKYGSLDVLQPYGPPRPVSGIVFINKDRINMSHGREGGMHIGLDFGGISAYEESQVAERRGYVKTTVH